MGCGTADYGKRKIRGNRVHVCWGLLQGGEVSARRCRVYGWCVVCVLGAYCGEKDVPQGVCRVSKGFPVCGSAEGRPSLRAELKREKRKGKELAGVCA